MLSNCLIGGWEDFITIRAVAAFIGHSFNGIYARPSPCGIRCHCGWSVQVPEEPRSDRNRYQGTDDTWKVHYVHAEMDTDQTFGFVCVWVGRGVFCFHIPQISDGQLE